MSTERQLDIAFWTYDRVRPLMEGDVSIAGARASFHTSRIVTEIFERMIRKRDLDVSELGFTYYLRTLDEPDPPFVAIPVFPNRAFGHSAIYVNRKSGIRRPQDLRGKTVGELALYGHDSGVVPKGILSDEYGVTPDQCRWIVGGIDFPMDPIDFVPRPHPANVEVRYADKGTDLGKMLEAGEIDALISADVPRCVLEGSPRVGRLFEDYPAVERAYYERTGMFPIMHLVAITRELAQDRKLVGAIYRALCEAKDRQLETYTKGMTFNSMAFMVPWLTKLLEDNRALLGQDWWPYGIAANRKVLDTYLRYHHEQGLSKRLWKVEEIFVPELLET